VSIRAIVGPHGGSWFNTAVICVHLSSVHLTGTSRLFRNAHHLGHWAKAASGGLDPDPATRVRGALYDKIYRETPDPATRVVIEVGMSRSLESNDLLRSLLYGNQQLPELGIIIGTYNGALVPGVDGQQDVADTIDDAVHKRVPVLDETLAKILDRIETEQASEPLRCVDTTLQRLDVYRHGLETGR
jgi:hypothetical protein